MGLKPGVKYFHLEDIPCGSIFETQDGVRAVKSEYRYSNNNSQPMCILLASGEFAHFPEKQKKIVCIVDDLYDVNEDPFS